MKQFLLFLMAAVLVFSIATLPAAGALPLEVEPSTITPTEPFIQATYHICFRDDGRMLTGSSGSVYTNQYIQNNTSMQWVFEGPSGGPYSISPVSAPEYYLTVNPETCAVSLETIGGTGIKQWEISTTSAGTMLSPYSTDSRVSGKQLYSSGYPFTASVQSSGSLLELISPSALVPITSFSWDNARTYVEVSKQLTPHTYSPANATYTDASWFEYSSANPTICTIDQNGVVTGVSTGSAVIQVTHKIYRTTKSCYVDVWPVIQLNCELYYDKMCEEKFDDPVAELSLIFNAASDDILTEFGIRFTKISIAMEEDLKGYLCSNTPLTARCNASCGVESSCYDTHHKNSNRLIDINSDTTETYIMRIVSHSMCDYEYGSHIYVAGQGDVFPNDNGDDTIVSAVVRGNIKGIMLHELSHNLGAMHETCDEINCVILDPSYGKAWCSTCSNAILNFRNYTN